MMLTGNALYLCVVAEHGRTRLVHVSASQLPWSVAE
jgi:hypothetical protein